MPPLKKMTDLVFFSIERMPTTKKSHKTTILYLSITTLLNDLGPLVCAPRSSALNSHTTTRLDDIILPSALVKNKDILNCFATQMTEVANTATTFLS